MRRACGGAVLLIAAILLAGSGSGLASTGTFPQPVATGQAGEILGFEPGEERHYVLGPPEALGNGEAARWGIRLAEVDSSGSERFATFELVHEREAPREREAIWTPGQVTHAQVTATLVVNAYGAPISLGYASHRHIYDVGDELFQVEYRYAGDKYEKRVALQGFDWDLDVDLIEHAGLDTDVPLGLFAFAPSAVDCLEWRVGAVVEQRTGTGDVAPGPVGVQSVDRQGRATADGATLASGDCYEGNTDPAFANPGLVSLVMPLLWERRGDSELVLFSPLRPDLVRGQGNGIPVTASPIIPSIPLVPGGSILAGRIPGLDIGAMLGGGGTDGDEERARDPLRYFFPRRMQLSERQRVDVGERKMDALPMQIDGYGGTVWVDDWGQVVRLDVPAAREGDPQRWVRILHASEY